MSSVRSGRRRVVSALVVVVAAIGLAAVPAAARSGSAKGANTPRRGGEVTWGLEAESTGGYCLPSGQLRDLRDHGHQRDLRHADHAQRQGPVRPVPGQVGHAECDVRRVDDRAATRCEVPRRRGGRRRGREAEPRQPTVASNPKVQARINTFTYANIADVTVVDPLDGVGQDEDAVAGVPRVPVPRRPHRHRRARAARRPRRRARPT